MSLEMGPVDFHLPTRVAFGWGAVARVGELAAPLGRRALLVTMRDLPHGARVAELLRAGGIDVEVWDGAEPDPSVEGIDSAAPMVREGGFDFMVAVGGGSAMDTAKALCLLAGNGGAAWEFTIEAGGDRRMGGPETLPLLAVPTTAGTGSEVTLVAVMTNRSLRKKAPIRDPRVYPAVALVDPELTVSMPPLLTAATGFDAFTHAYERFFGGRLSALVHLLATTAMRAVVEHLETAVHEPADRDARTALAWAATQAGIALGPPGGEAALHIFGLPQGAVAGVSHGESLATMMRVITRARPGSAASDSGPACPSTASPRPRSPISPPPSAASASPGSSAPTSGRPTRAASTWTRSERGRDKARGVRDERRREGKRR